ncbi:MAG: hypothetical protein BHV91_05210 [Clostridiales bacterium 44_9]|nr:MAG: hypothetical protein BHV91_05210 [Clostridiales bacterium 44_9]
MRFDALKNNTQPVMSQQLLSPLAVELSAEDAASLLEQLPLLEEFGFQAEDLNGALIVRQAPDYLDVEDIPGTLSELASGRTKQLTLKHARPIAEYFGVTIAQLAGDEPLETEPDQTDAVSDLIRDEPIAAYENLKRYLTEEDKADIATLIRLRAEINQGKQ